MNRRAGGFTLIEVLIALFITALALTLGFSAVRTGARTVEHLEQSVLADWVLDNALAEIRLSAQMLQEGRRRTAEKIFGREFLVDAQISRRPEVLPTLQVILRVSEAGHAGQILAEFNDRIVYAAPPR